MVDFRTRLREIWGDGRNHHEKLGLKRISSVSQFTIPGRAGTSSDPACNYTNTRSPQPNQVCHNPDFSYPLVSSATFSSSSPISLFLIHNSTIITEHKVKSSLSICPCHDHELTLSTAYTEYSIHRVLHTPSTASTRDCLFSLHSHDQELTPECSFSFRRTSLHDRPLLARSPWALKGKVTLSHSHGCQWTNWWLQSHHSACHPSTASKYSSNIPQYPPPSASHNSLGHGLQVYLETHSITASKCISKVHSISASKCMSQLVRSLPPSPCPNSLCHGHRLHLQTRSITASECISKLSPLRPPSSHDRDLQVHLPTRWITAPKCISKLGRLRSRSVSLSSLDQGLQVYLQIRSVTTSKCISKVARWRPWSVSLSSLDRHYQGLHEFLTSTACSQSRYTVCRWVAI